MSKSYYRRRRYSRKSTGPDILALIILFFIVAPISGYICRHECKHEQKYLDYSFGEEADSMNNVTLICSNCGHSFRIYNGLKGLPVDTSLLSAFDGCISPAEIEPGGYYTVTAVAPIDFSQLEDEPVLNLRVKNDGYEVNFHARFKDEYFDLIQKNKKDEQITFYGRFFDTGCGFYDCELINTESGLEQGIR